MKHLQIAFLGLLLLALSACEKINGDGPVVTETRNMTGFSGVDLRMSGTVYFTQDSVYKIELHAQQNILDKIETNILNGRLVIRHKNNIAFRSYDPVNIMVSGPDMSFLRVNGSGNIKTTHEIITNQLEAEVNGSGDIVISDLKADIFDATINGSGKIKANAGTVREEKLKISGSGDLDLTPIAAVKAQTNITGSGSIRLQVSDDLQVSISGSGTVYYKGQPTIDTRISGSGKVVRL